MTRFSNLGHEMDEAAWGQGNYNSGTYEGHRGVVEANVYQRTVDYLDEWANIKRKSRTAFSRLRHTSGEPNRAIIRTHIKAPSFLLPRVLFLMPGMCSAYLRVRTMKNVKPYAFSGDAFSLRTSGLTGITSCWIVRS